MVAAKDKASRPYGIIVMGATGVTGTMVCEHIAANLPTNLEWAIAGRSPERLSTLAAKLKSACPDRVQPSLEVVIPNDPTTLGAAIGKAKVCISVVVYHEDGESVVQACVQQGTDYVDCASVPVLLRDWISKYHKQAEENGVALIHACGALSGEMDLLAIHAHRTISEKWATQMGKVTLRADYLDTRCFNTQADGPSSSNVSGGTLRTMITVASGGPKDTAAAGDPSLLTPVPYTTTVNTVRGVHRHPVLGLLSDSSMTGLQARTLINRSWGLLGGPKGSWGPKFQYNQYERAHSYLGGILSVLRYQTIIFLLSLVRFAWFKNLLLRSIPPVGSGPTAEESKSQPFTATVLVEADPSVEKNRGKGCLVKMRYAAGSYPFVAMLLAQAGATLLYDRNLSAGNQGGSLTAGVLGPDFVKRAESGGLEIETTMLYDLQC
ncbi:Saccharopine dehydrogenase-domain-containing protein [Emericellopsis atlantica]|uniref:Saccharopine dehydrogenase-domain-containing protein n=1 Tax=Emericellopsis atlantica TaxID=2614577 RepID=A0A9P8CPP5_9HYPO|nr:Saccharopine dehydrogenase-domain-containing protein [Emericellopsis atlantica]KAG9252961.1 Saccharopine dehydrogenase-domain-containing protein [Emericellopsis atlantica]